MKLTLLRNFLLLDAVVLFGLGGLLIFAPSRIELAFHFEGLPAGVSYLIGLWGCAMATLALGYVVAATNPIRHVVWVQVGIARGLAEVVLGLVCLARGIVTFQQSGFGIVLAGLMSLGYLALYPRQPRRVDPAAAPVPIPPESKRQ